MDISPRYVLAESLVPSHLAPVDSNGAEPLSGSLPAAGRDSLRAPYAVPAWRRYLGAAKRYKWLLLIGPVAGGALGRMAAARVSPQYEVSATVWLSSETPQGEAAGPLSPARLLNGSSWPELLSSFAILDSVARKSRSYIMPARGTPPQLFADFSTADQYVPGQYELRLNRSGDGYELVTANKIVVERGTPGDSIGRQLGFRWAPPADVLTRAAPVRFGLTTLRDAAIGLRSHLAIVLPRESSILRMTLTGADPKQTTATMHSLIAEFLSTAARLRNRNIVEFATSLQQQVESAAQDLRNAEIALETFRVHTITLPSENAGSVAAGLETARDPVLQHYFDQKLQLDSIRNDRVSLEGLLVDLRHDGANSFSLLSVPSVHTSAELTAALTELAAKQAALRNALQTYTEQHRSVIELRQRIAALENETIPQLTATLVENLRRRERDLQQRVDASSHELQLIPARTIEELRLRRNVEVRQQLYTMLTSRYEEARLGQASALPDLSVLDYPAVPQRPSRNTAPQILLLGTAGGFGVVVLLVLLLEQVDPRFRRPEQATYDLGLDIMGVVPRIRPSDSNRTNPEHAWQLVESFRTIRMALWHHQPKGPRMLSITSPASGDGKSLIAANLAASLAKAGSKTILVDADVRRGSTHVTFGIRGRPGLTDYLSERAILDDTLHVVDHNLTVIPSGTRGPRAPELLASTGMADLLKLLRDRFDAIVIDCAPLNAGVDAFILGTLTTDLLVVLRHGVTDCRLAEAKLRVLDRLPVRVLGAVLNAVQTTGEYRYYAYDYETELPTAQSKRLTIPLFG